MIRDLLALPALAPPYEESQAARRGVETWALLVQYGLVEGDSTELTWRGEQLARTVQGWWV